MSITIVPISDEQARRILALDESHFLDLKSLDIAPAKLTRTISALANASGGELYVGIDERTVDSEKQRFWRGFSDPEAANGHLQVFEQLFPLGQYYSYLFLSSAIGPGLVLQVSINKTRELTKASDGVVYLRRGAQNLPMFASLITASKVKVPESCLVMLQLQISFRNSLPAMGQSFESLISFLIRQIKMSAKG